MSLFNPAQYPEIDNARLCVGMEIHVELATRSKMWTAAPNVAHSDYFEAEPNSLLSPVVVGMPGTLPVINEHAVELSIRVGLALNCEIARRCKWDRKSYYYPDLPKNYQISQYDQPICGEGYLDIPLSDAPGAAKKRIRITRAHLEEDAGKLQHEAPGGGRIDFSIVDLNRAGTPLLEIVTEPDFETPEQCVMFGQMLRDICRHLGVTQGIMQRGHMRFEPNINVIITKEGKEYRTPIVEIKNLNSFKAVQGSVAYEFHRQIEEFLKTGQVMGQRSKSTRGWDDGQGITTHQRHKEDEDEYRYFPDPDLIPLEVSDAWMQRITDEQPELPYVKRDRYLEEYGLDIKQTRALLDEPATTRFFEAVLAAGVEPKRAASLLLNYGAKIANERGVGIHNIGITPEQVAGIAELAAADKIGSNAVDQLFTLCCDQQESAASLAEKHGLLQVSDTGELGAFVDQVIADPKNEKAVTDIRGGKDKAIGALMGQIMKLTKGKANPKMVTEMIKAKLSG